MICRFVNTVPLRLQYDFGLETEIIAACAERRETLARKPNILRLPRSGWILAGPCWILARSYLGHACTLIRPGYALTRPWQDCWQSPWHGPC